MTGQIILTAAGGWPSTTNGCAEPVKTEFIGNDQDLWVLAFDQDADEFAQWTVVMPDDWDGSTVNAVFYWTADGGAGAETVEWNLQGRSYGDDEAIDQAWGVSVAVSDTWLADGDVHITAETASITLAGTPAADELVQFRAWRDVSGDDLGADALLLSIKVIFGRT